LFGDSGNEGSQQLVLNGGALVFDTSSSQFILGVDNQGWWSPNDPGGDISPNYAVGTFQQFITNNFFTFDISDLDVPIRSGYLSLPRFLTTGPLPTTYRLFDVSTDAATLNANNGTNVGIFNDLGSGVLYGSVVVSDLLLPDPLVIDLNASAIAAINAAAGSGERFFSIGGTLTGPVPEPGTVILVGSGLAGLAFRSRRKSRAELERPPGNLC